MNHTETPHETHTSEWVSLGHPDKLADYISSYILDRYIERDPDTRYAVEVQIKDNFVSLAGEVTSKAEFGPDAFPMFVRAAVNHVGYTSAYQATWGRENTICADDLEVVTHIGQQSPDIAKGVDRDGWGDQGIFWGMAVDEDEQMDMPLDAWLARRIGMRVTDRNLALGGLDVKTQVRVEDDVPREVVVAVPLDKNRGASTGMVESVVRAIVGGYECKVTINGTGDYRRHGPVGDCGTTGRKLAVDFYGGNCPIGGGSPWTKDGTKADVALNILARRLAFEFMERNGLGEARCALSCCIGRREVRADYYNGIGARLESKHLDLPVSDVLRRLGLRAPVFAGMCAMGLPYWEWTTR